VRLVVDANVLFSALIRDGVTRKLFFEDRLELFAPEYLFEEFAGHRKEILQKSQRSEVEFGHVMTILRGRITEILLQPSGVSCRNPVQYLRTKRMPRILLLPLQLTGQSGQMTRSSRIRTA
jgi:predicted nucleic acid-binding protein